jgi:hypothetical protein
MLFASLATEREPLQWSQFPEVLTLWLQTAGGVAAFGIALVLITLYLSRESHQLFVWQMPAQLRFFRPVLRLFVAISGLGYAVLLLAWLGKLTNLAGAGNFLPRGSASDPLTYGDRILMLSGTLALLVAMAPFLIDVFTRIRLGRIWAIALLSWKEAVRGRVIWVFGFIALIFLFADWFVTAKAEDQVRSYVRVVYWSITPLFLITAGLLGSFSIPTDVKNNSIHTIVTKPVEKFEIVIGRFLGYAALLTIGLFVVSSLSLIYVVRGVNEEAARESYKARVPYFGSDLHFAGTADRRKGESVGREWSYRTYIKGPVRRRAEKFRQYAIWDFTEIPPDLGRRDTPIRFEFTFDIFRLSKGEEGKGVFVTFTFADGDREAAELDALTKKIAEDRREMETAASKEYEQTIRGKEDAERRQLYQQYQKKLAEIDTVLMTKYRIYQVRGQEVTDFHTQEFEVPAEIFKILLEAKPGNGKPRDAGTPPMRAFLSVDVANEQQMLGVARQDFYLLAYEKPFWWNFLKGVVGLWCTHMIVLGVAVALSTYFSAVISLLCAAFLFIAGMNGDYLKEIADKKLDGGGPTESMLRLTNRTPLAVKFDPSPTTSVVQTVDDTFSWWIRVIMNLVPDVNRHDLHPYVANGFDIGEIDLLVLDNLLPLFGYLLPWAVLAYYLMKYREIANPS